MWQFGAVKTTVDLPDALLRTAKATAAARGQSLEEFLAEAVRDKVPRDTSVADLMEPRWMHGFGGLRDLSDETARVQAEIDREFSAVEVEAPR